MSHFKGRAWLGAVMAVVVSSLVAGPVAASSVVAQRATASGPSRPIRWLAAGDSYSSGEGLHSTLDGKCQRAPGPMPPQASVAWAGVAKSLLPTRSLTIAKDAGPAAKGFDFVACSGAVSDDLFNNHNNKQEWSPDGNGKFDLATFSFGGDNIGFSKVVHQCLGLTPQGAVAAATGGLGGWYEETGCPSEADIRAQIDLLGSGGNMHKGHKLMDEPTFLTKVATDIMNPGGNVVVVGYPEIIEDPLRWNPLSIATGLCAGIRIRDAKALRRIGGYLNQTIGNAVALVNKAHPNGVHFTFVDVNTAQADHQVASNDPKLYEPSSGTRHNLCTNIGPSQEWMNGITGENLFNGSFHPNQKGQTAMGQLVANRIQTLNWSNLKYPGQVTTRLQSGGVAPLGCAVEVVDSYDQQNNDLSMVAVPYHWGGSGLRHSSLAGNATIAIMGPKGFVQRADASRLAEFAQTSEQSAKLLICGVVDGALDWVEEVPKSTREQNHFEVMTDVSKITASAEYELLSKCNSHESFGACDELSALHPEWAHTRSVYYQQEQEAAESCGGSIPSDLRNANIGGQNCVQAIGWSACPSDAEMRAAAAANKSSTLNTPGTEITSEMVCAGGWALATWSRTATGYGMGGEALFQNINDTVTLLESGGGAFGCPQFVTQHAVEENAKRIMCEQLSHPRSP